MNQRVDFRDEKGIMRRVIIPHEGADYQEGVPVSLPIERLYAHMPSEFLVRLSDALYARGLVEPEDFLKPGASELARLAVLDVVRYDALDLVTLANSLVEK